MEATDFLQFMSDQDMAILGLQDVAYVKPVVVDGQDAFSIHAADGTTIAIMADREVVVATIRQHDLEPVSVH